VDESAHSPEHDRPDGALGADGADDGTDPVLDPHVEDQVRTLLAGAPDPGPMPEAVAQRISRALLDEARLRVDPGPLSTSRPGAPGSEGATVLTLPSGADARGRSDRPRPLYLAAAVAAAVVVVAGGASALHLTKRANGAAVVGDTVSSSTTSSPSSPPATEGLHIQLSTTAYTAGTLARQARRLLDQPGEPLRDLAAESPSIGPIGTPIGLESCLEALGAIGASNPTPDAVSADLATFEGRPAVVVVVTRDGASTAWAAERSCTTGTPGLLAGATPVP
jgi:hypothetical protein